MAKISVLFFGATADSVGMRRLGMEVPDGAPAASIFSGVVAKYPELRKYNLLFSINEAYAVGDEQIGDGDELALFTPVSGG